jgi:uncharacterized protein
LLVPDTSRPRRYITLALIGIAGGLLSGMFGVGGGIILIPLLMDFAKFDQRRAAATSLLAILPTSIAGSITYAVSGEIDLIAAALIAVGAVGGSFIGTALLRRISLAVLRWIFIALLVVVAIRMLLIVPVRGEPLPLSVGVVAAYIALGLVMGVASGLLGIGGGVIAVPALVAIFGVSDLIAKGTSLLVMIPTALTGTISNWRAGLVDVPTGLIVGGAAAVASIAGARISLALDPRAAAISFAVFIVAVAIQLSVRAIRSRTK